MVIAHIQNLFIEIQNEGINIVGITKIDEEEEFKHQQTYEEDRETDKEDNVLRKPTHREPPETPIGEEDSDEDEDDEDSEDDDDDDDDDNDE